MSTAARGIEAGALLLQLRRGQRVIVWERTEGGGERDAAKATRLQPRRANL